MSVSWPKVRLGEVLIERREVPDAKALALGNIRIVFKIGFDFGKIEQRRIVAYLDGLQTQMDTLRKLQAETAAELNALLPSILDRAFKGEL